ncbi:hypothetical protein LWI28_016983 [Acer negundo]|uniref:Uncharacterized protein n=1 Tax=Acer negundo TaxID=4023 RepID=A0AAD5IM21_ACENE|nr:hypothetical protein LWI28_016983 [Acer negundo]
MEGKGKGKGVDKSAKKRKRIVSSFSILPADLFSKAQTSKCPQVVETSGGVTISQALGTLLDTEKKYEKVKEVNSKLYEKIKRDRGSVEALKENFIEASSSYRESKAKC